MKRAQIPLGRAGPFYPDMVHAILRCSLIIKVLAWHFVLILRCPYCSMSGDLLNGQNEIDNFNSHLIELAGNSTCGLNRLAHDLVKSMERDRIILVLYRFCELDAQIMVHDSTPTAKQVYELSWPTATVVCAPESPRVI